MAGAAGCRELCRKAPARAARAASTSSGGGPRQHRVRQVLLDVVLRVPHQDAGQVVQDVHQRIADHGPRPVHDPRLPRGIPQQVVRPQVRVGEVVTVHDLEQLRAEGLQAVQVLRDPGVQVLREPGGLQFLPGPALRHEVLLGPGQVQQGAGGPRQGGDGVEDRGDLLHRVLGRVGALDVLQDQHHPALLLEGVQEARGWDVRAEQAHDLRLLAVQGCAVRMGGAVHGLDEGARAVGADQAVRTAGGEPAGLGLCAGHRGAQLRLHAGPDLLGQLRPRNPGAHPAIVPEDGTGGGNLPGQDAPGQALGGQATRQQDLSELGDLDLPHAHQLLVRPGP